MKIGVLERENELKQGKTCGKENSGTKRSISIPGILLNLAIESRVGAKKRKWRKENEAHHLFLLNVIHFATAQLGARGSHIKYWVPHVFNPLRQNLEEVRIA